VTWPIQSRDDKTTPFKYWCNQVSSFSNQFCWKKLTKLKKRKRVSGEVMEISTPK